ncbi:MAG: hypothetical protein ACREOF_15180 [Gemmatimonadales bacterium]
MRRFALFCSAAVLVGCTKSEDQPARDTTAAAPATPETPATISLADVAGKWKVRTTDEAGGNVVESEMTATADTLRISVYSDTRFGFVRTPGSAAAGHRVRVESDCGVGAGLFPFLGVSLLS